jgi:hypothetical protein
MVLTTYKKKGIRLTHVWFATAKELQELAKGRAGSDVFFIHGAKYIDGPFSTMVFEQPSLIKHITDEEADVWGTYGKHLKAYIKRSIREESTVQIFRGNDISPELLDTCAELYEQMKAAKGMVDTFNRLLAESYTKQDALVISMDYVNNKPVGFNAYIADDSHFRTWLTAFAFREEEFDAQVVSRAHQLLEWETMRYCCQKGIVSYDFGGIESFDNPNGIDQFKINFAKEGDRVTYDNFLLGSSLLGKAGIVAYKLYKKVKK